MVPPLHLQKCNPGLNQAGILMKILDANLFDTLSSEAAETPRLRKHLNLHASYDEPSQRLLIAMEPGSYLRPHRHLVIPKPENFVCLRGAMMIVHFGDGGAIISAVRIGPGEEVAGADVPSGEWHTVFSLETGSIFLETKPGPYTSIPAGDMAGWAPAEGDVEVLEYQKRLHAAAFNALTHVK